MDVSLDETLGCGQAHRWIKKGDSWEGVLGHDIITLTQTSEGFVSEGCSDSDIINDYFRVEDDMLEIIDEISKADPFVAELSGRCKGLRILKQDEWECLATYLLATNVNVKRIAKMVESVCDHFGDDLGARRAFPTPAQILEGKEKISECKLGFRESRFIELAERVNNGEICLNELKTLDYTSLVTQLQTINGVGPKVADCVALFAFGKLEAFPVDVRIANSMETLYGVKGSYKVVSAFGMERFGRYAGYAQEYLYHYGT